jgi:hypothetical protein
LGNGGLGYLIYRSGSNPSVQLSPGIYTVYAVDEKSGEVKISMKSAKISSVYEPSHPIEWLQRK